MSFVREMCLIFRNIRMKKLFVLFLAIALLGFTEEPNNLVVNSLSDIETHKELLKQLTDEDRKSLLKYLLRKEIAKKNNQEGNFPNGLNVRQLIDAQNTFEKERTNKRKSLEHKKEESLATLNKMLPLKIVGSKVGENVINNKELIFSISITNNSGKKIKALKKGLEYSIDNTNEKHKIAYLGVQQFEPELSLGESHVFEVSLSLDNMFALKAELNVNKVRVRFLKAEILYSDGTSESIGEMPFF